MRISGRGASLLCDVSGVMGLWAGYRHSPAHRQGYHPQHSMNGQGAKRVVQTYSTVLHERAVSQEGASNLQYGTVVHGRAGCKTVALTRFPWGAPPQRHYTGVFKRGGRWQRQVLATSVLDFMGLDLRAFRAVGYLHSGFVARVEAYDALRELHCTALYCPVWAWT